MNMRLGCVEVEPLLLFLALLTATALVALMDLAMNIAVGSSIQIALFVAPMLVFIGYLSGQPMNLLFTTFEVVSVVFPWESSA